MNYLQYTSKEMYSSTELIRKSKMIFEKLNKKEIEKAIILRDGKPSFMLLDFETYEDIMTEYVALKEQFDKPKKEKKEEPKKIKAEKKTKEPKKEEKVEEIVKDEVKSAKEIEEDELQRALKEIDDINFDDYSEPTTSTTTIIDDIVIEEQPIGEKQEKALKEFWD